MRSPYEILNVPQHATLDEVKSAYRKLAKQLHPDVNKASDATERLAELNNAFDTIKGRRPLPRVPPPKRDWSQPKGALKFYEFVPKFGQSVTIETGTTMVPSGSIVYLMWNDQEYRVRLDGERIVPFSLQLNQPPIILHMVVERK